MWNRWRENALFCRYGNQDLFKLLGRDPLTQPLTAIERALFWDALLELLDREATPPTPSGGSE